MIKKKGHEYKFGIIILVFFCCQYLMLLPNYFSKSFDDCMEESAAYKHDVAGKKRDWTLARELYTKNLLENNEFSKVPKIPKIIHRIWLGSPLPEKEESMGETWKTNHPEWIHILWTDDDIEQLNLVNKVQYDASVNWGEKSDIARYEILYRFGGLYVDTDFSCLKSFDIFHHLLDFYVGVDYNPAMTIHNSLIAAKPGHYILKKCIDAISKKIITPTNDPAKIMSRTGPSFLTNLIKNSLLKTTMPDKFVIFPAPYFYPLPPHERWEPAKAIERIRPETHAVHYWHTRWVN